MSNKPIFVATHPRSCSTAFERVFMTCRDTLQCLHEPFGDAFYYGPERLSGRYEDDEKARMESGFSNSTFKKILDRIEQEGDEGKRLFIKDIIHYIFPPNGATPSIAPSLDRKERGIGTSSKLYTHSASPKGEKSTPYPYATEPEPGNPTVVPSDNLQQFHFTFLIRHPRSSIPSYYRCTVPPHDKLTGFYNFDPSEAGYDELRRFFDYVSSIGLVGPRIATRTADGPETDGVASTIGNVKTNDHAATNGNSFANGHTNGYPDQVEICVVDADDLLDNPKGVIEAYCKSVGIEYSDKMLNWDSERDRQQAKDAFKKWAGFHEDAMNSCDLKPRTHKKEHKTREEEDNEWREKFGENGAKIIRETVDKNVADYEHLKQFALKV